MRRYAAIAVVLVAASYAMVVGAPARAQQLERMRANMAGSGMPAEGGRCQGITVIVRAAGYATWLGAYAAEQEHCVDPTGPDPLAFTDGTYRWMNEQGDSIFGRYNGRLRTAEGSEQHGFFILDGRFTIEGGTGRFAGARGHGQADGLLNPTTGLFNIALDAAFALPAGRSP